ncbi:MAG: rhomboid family intramembrane serine protease [Aquiluna sp.]|uniref:rhomboid family intramembrane serine protease n=1 Tax=Aquiluna sp. TaxID=2053504 RepID=UPI0027729F47|nr:rhomboid family intramembrane serine protease [Aquiluna sp.]MDP4887007.1 rhomboid family intramembrane serine protease [Aquiluna sp.]
MAFRLRRGSIAPITSALLIINVLVWLGQISPIGLDITYEFFFAPLLAMSEPWRMLSAGFVHDWTGPIHILFNSYAIWIFGRQLEPMLGPLRFLILYLTSIVGGSVAVLWLSDPVVPVVGASGALFGLMAAFFVIIRATGGNASQLFGLIAINFALGFFVSGISWEGHLGGMVAGFLIAFVYAKTRRPNQLFLQLVGIGLVWVAIVGLTMWRIDLMF